MGKISTDIASAIAQLAGDSEAARINMRTRQVRQRYREAIESVYRQNAALHLAHTNNVIITDKGGVKTLIVYVDDSLFAAELNAQRELIRLRLLELFGEDVQDFQIRTSQWKKYRDHHPYLEETAHNVPENLPTVPLDEDELSSIADTASVVEDARVRKSLERAMTADLERKKSKSLQ